MRVILKVLNGLREGHHMVLVNRQTLEVGRSALSDLNFEYDNMMSGTHFSLTVEGESCFLKDLNSTNGTFVNDTGVRETLVVHKDVILAGQTRFAVFVEGAISERPLKKTLVAEESSIGLLPTSYGMVQEESGIFRCFGQTDRTLPSNVARIMRKSFEQVIIVDVTKLPEKHRAGLPPSIALFDWLPDEASQQAPQMFTDADALNRFPLIDVAWGLDAMILVYSAKGEEAPIEHLRRSSAAFARPSLLWPQLMQTDTSYATNLIGELSAVLMEAPEGKDWSIHSIEDMSVTLNEAGMFPSKSN